MKCDVSKEAEIEACVKKVLEEFGRLDIVVSGAQRSRTTTTEPIILDSSTTPVSCTPQTTMHSSLMKRFGT